MPEFFEGIKKVVAEYGISDYEPVCVNDGSPDDSLQYAIEQKTNFKELVILDLSRNFGHHYAAHAGISYASCELIFVIDCDLEVSPSVLVDFYKKIKSSSADVVYGYQEKRKGGIVEKNLGGLFWNVFNK